MNDANNKGVLNNESIFKTFEDRNSNYQYWTERYSNNPNYAVPDTREMGGSGFITQQKDNWRDLLDARQTELKYTTNEQDKHRMTLLLNAETAACRSSNHHAREEFSKLLEYDKKHNHPLADNTRDLKKDPYTKAEFHQWMNRDGRTPSSREEHHLTHDRSWDGKQKNPEQELRAISSLEWFIAPSVKEQQSQRQVQEVSGYTLSSERIAQFRKEKEANTDRGVER